MGTWGQYNRLNLVLKPSLFIRNPIITLNPHQLQANSFEQMPHMTKLFEPSLKLVPKQTLVH